MKAGELMHIASRFTVLDDLNKTHHGINNESKYLVVVLDNFCTDTNVYI